MLFEVLEAQPLLGVHLQKALHQAVTLLRNERPTLSFFDASNNLLVTLWPQVLRGVDVEGPLPAEHGVEHDAKGPEVRPLVVNRREHLRRHEVWRADDGVPSELRRRVVVAHKLREPQVRDLDVVQLEAARRAAGGGQGRRHARIVDEHVLELQVSVQNVLGVHVGDAIHELLGHVPGAGLVAAQATEGHDDRRLDLLLNLFVQVASGSQIHHQEALAPLPDVGVQVDDPRVVQLAHVADLLPQIFLVLLGESHGLDIDSLDGIPASGGHPRADMNRALAPTPKLFPELKGVLFEADRRPLRPACCFGSTTTAAAGHGVRM
mmetsp:Transcript_94015/g.239337  ORF Transcript_94015/g.239337 Transcript_94015/m.239337 type:complete len:321 (-) Transcript_94015:53-1015(-)